MNIQDLRIAALLGLGIINNPAAAQGIDNMIADQIQEQVANQVQQQVARQVSSAISRNLFEKMLIPQLTIRNESGEVQELVLSADQRYYAVLHRDDSIRVWDSIIGVQRPVIRGSGQGFKRVQVDSANGLVLAGGVDGKVYAFELLTAKPVGEMAGEGGKVVAMSLAENKLAVAYNDGRVGVWDLNGLIKLKSFDSRHGQDLTDVFFSDDGQSLVLTGADGFVETWHWQEGRLIAELPKLPGRTMGLWSNKDGSVAYVGDKGRLHWQELPGNRERLNRKIEEGREISSATLSFASKQIAVTSNTQIKLFSLDDLSFPKQILPADNISHLRFINQDKQLLGADEKGVLHIWNVGQAGERLKLISTAEGWTVVDSSGRFDSSEPGMANVSWMAANQDIPIDSFSGKYYEPGLLASQLHGEELINQPQRKVQDGIKLPPTVSLTVPESGEAGEALTVTFEAVDNGGGIGEHRLYHNGKIVELDKLDDRNEFEADDIRHLIISYKLAPTPGLNSFKVVVANDMGIDSPAQQQTLQIAGEELPAKLHVLAIGIDKYSDENLNLAYSVADANAIKTTLSQEGAGVFAEVVVHDLLDQDATKQAIADKLADMADDTADDVLVVYLAGHGIAVNGEWYFLPYETHLPISEAYIGEVGVSANQIRSLLTQIPAQKILVLIDSCYSGAGLSALRNLQNTQRHFGRALSKSVGVVVLTATRQDQEAMELTDLGHGLFTYVTNNGMQGAADSQPKDRKISAYELVKYSTATIPAFAKKYTKAAQEPAAFTIGEDFVLLGRESAENANY